MGEALQVAVDAGTTAGVPERPYASSWMNRIVAAIDGLPGPTWLAFLALTGLAIVWRASVGWLGGWSPVGFFDPTLLPHAVFPIFPFALLHILDRAAARAVRVFAPALDASPAEVARIERELRTIPAGSGAIVGLLGAGYALVLWLADFRSTVDGVPLASLVVRAIGEWTYFGAWFVLIYQVVRQLRLVTQLHRRATHLDLYQPAPLHAFSQLTVRAGIGFVLIAAWELLVYGPEPLASAQVGASLASAVVVGAAAFIVPLLGLHDRLVEERERLLSAANGRLQIVIAALHAAVDTNNLDTVQQVQVAIAALVQEREILSKLRTWPWDPGTLAAFASAVVLPIALSLVSLVLGRLF